LENPRELVYGCGLRCASPFRYRLRYYDSIRVPNEIWQHGVSIHTVDKRQLVASKSLLLWLNVGLADQEATMLWTRLSTFAVFTGEERIVRRNTISSVGIRLILTMATQRRYVLNMMFSESLSVKTRFCNIPIAFSDQP
jgi:hypothetical protein